MDFPTLKLINEASIAGQLIAYERAEKIVKSAIVEGTQHTNTEIELTNKIVYKILSELNKELNSVKQLSSTK